MTKSKTKKKKIKVDETWDDLWAGPETGLLAVYLSDGIYLHPCGDMTDAEDGGDETRCSCKLCKSLQRQYDLED